MVARVTAELVAPGVQAGSGSTPPGTARAEHSAPDGPPAEPAVADRVPSARCPGEADVGAAVAGGADGGGDAAADAGHSGVGTAVGGAELGGAAARSTGAQPATNT